MSLLPFSIFKQGGQEYEVVDKAARNDIAQLSDDLNSKIKVFNSGNWTIPAQSYVHIGVLPTTYQGASSYIVSAKLNGAYLIGGVNASGDYQIYLYNALNSELTFSDVMITCVF